jgi:hypothetical protein
VPVATSTMSRVRRNGDRSGRFTSLCFALLCPCRRSLRFRVLGIGTGRPPGARGSMTGAAPLNRRPAGALGDGGDRGVVFGAQVRDAPGVRRGPGGRGPWWSQIRHHHTTVSTDAIASMLISSVAGRQTVTVVMVLGPCPSVG